MTLVEMARYFAEHAASDLGQAQTIARSDRSGHALATAMYLAQQSIEKQLKSIIINMDEKMGLGKSGSIPRLLGHQLYPNLCKFYDRQITSLDTPPPLPDWSPLTYDDLGVKHAPRIGRAFRLMGEFWTLHLKDPKLQSLLWQNSMGITLDDRDLLFLNSKHNPYHQGFLAIADKGDEEIPQLVNNGHMQRPMLVVIVDDALLSTYRKEYADIDINIDGRAMLERGFAWSQLLLDIVSKPKPKQSSADVVAANNIVFSFVVQVLVSRQSQYMPLLTNSSYGRYPQRLENGRITTDMYESQLDRVLHYLFIDIPYQLNQLRVNSYRLDVLLDIGHEFRHW